MKKRFIKFHANNVFLINKIYCYLIKTEPEEKEILYLKD